MNVTKREKTRLDEIDKDTCALMELVLKEQKLKRELDISRQEKSHFKLDLIKKYHKKAYKLKATLRKDGV